MNAGYRIGEELLNNLEYPFQSHLAALLNSLGIRAGILTLGAGIFWAMIEYLVDGNRFLPAFLLALSGLVFSFASHQVALWVEGWNLPHCFHRT